MNAKIVAGRDEGDFYDALGVVSEGLIQKYGAVPQNDQLVTHRLDGQLWHGFPGSYGLRLSAGNDPNPDPFSLGEGGDGTQYCTDKRSAGLAFAEIRRSDTKGLQLSRLQEHAMQVVVEQGMKGWVWTAPGSRTHTLLVNPIWVAVNIYLRAIGLRFADATTCEQYFDVNAAIEAAAICDTAAGKLVGSTTTLSAILPLRLPA